jgi:hypothetical protein
MGKSWIAAGVALVLSSASALAENAECAAIEVPKGIVTGHGGNWVELTPAQWQFLRGIYALNPATPAGLPFGDRAALAQIADSDGALVFFLDGDKACTPMPVPHELVDMIRDVGTGEIRHVGAGLGSQKRRLSECVGELSGRSPVLQAPRLHCPPPSRFGPPWSEFARRPALITPLARLTGRPSFVGLRADEIAARWNQE